MSINNSIKSGRILIVDDDDDVLQAAKLFLKQHFRLIHTESDPNKIPILLKNERYDTILLDMNFTKDVTSGSEGIFWLEKIHELDPSAIVILITAFGDIDIAVKVIKAGAFDFIIKPWQNEKLLATISSAMSLRRSRLEVDSLRSPQKQLKEDMDLPYHNVLGSSSAMETVFNS